MTEIYFDYSNPETGAREDVSSSAPSSTCKRSYTFFLPLIAVVAIGFFVRFYGAPFLETAPQELRAVENAILFWDGLPPYNWEHPSPPLTFYWGLCLASLWSAVHFHSLRGLQESSNLLGEIPPLISQSISSFYANPSSVILLARVLNAMLGAFVLLWCYAIGRRLSSSSFGGFVASASACAMPVLVDAGASLSFGNMLAFGALGAIFFALRHVEEGGKASLVLACFFGGLACAVDVGGISTVAGIILSAAISKNVSFKKRAYLIPISLLIIAVSWLLFNPYLITDMPLGIVGLLEQLKSIAPGFTARGYPNNLSVLLRHLWIDMGVFAFVVAGLGVIASLLGGARKSLIVLVVMAVYPCFFLPPEFGERMTIIAGIFACFVGASAGVIAELFWKREMKTAAIVTGLALLIFGVPAWGCYKVLQSQLAGDTRSQAREWLYANVPPGSMVVLMAEGPLLPVNMASAERNLNRLSRLLFPSGDNSNESLFMRDAMLRKEFYLYKRYSYIKASGISQSPSFDVVELCCESFDLSLFNDVERFWAVVTPRLIESDSGMGDLGELAQVIRYGGRKMVKFRNTGNKNDLIIYEVWTSGHPKAEEDIQP